MNVVMIPYFITYTYVLYKYILYINILHVRLAQFNETARSVYVVGVFMDLV